MADNSVKLLSEDFRSCLRFFVFYYTNGTLKRVIGDASILEGIDYRKDLMEEASLVEQAFAIYSNNIRLDNYGKVLNHTHAMKRAAQWIRQVCDPGNYEVIPEFEEWEIELY